MDEEKRSKTECFINKIAKEQDFRYLLSKPIRLSTLYWYVASLRMLQIPFSKFSIPREEIIEYVYKCRNKDGLFGGEIGYPSNILATLNALQIFYVCKEQFYDTSIIGTILENFVDKETGAVKACKLGEFDTRYSCCLILILGLLLNNIEHSDDIFVNRKKNLSSAFNAENFLKLIKHPRKNVLCRHLNKIESVNLQNYLYKIVEFMLKCQNEDGGFGALPNCESHAANTFCVISSLRVLGLLNLIDTDKVADNIVFRQQTDGGFNGRINKKPDVCYSYWAYMCLVMMDKGDYIGTNELRTFIYSCLDDDGGFCDRKGNEPDLFHTLYALMSLSILGDKNLDYADPGYGI
ncbi:hypothetical protein EDEG_01073 [Edhazardia aedis USNM 41457]|uniref:Geranylgeranyl transferase type II subunit beta n=1 Tax=Edhazardia aedis (strain USNM 41457) TaxID=1003232 RepID=J9DQA0_EDHAE|nr:hypothetical protein EDEG_01073 [Edhazardia aedis USNM 41457]|eukprot:EJW04730.1 hypothetical protein EDEG_01073 [Edhazardia aedis USNM 41457]